jgi:hypothetical protein
MARLQHVNGSSKHVLRDIDDGPVLHAKRLARRPDYWEEAEDGDLQPVFIPKPPDPLFAHDELKPYRSDPAPWLQEQSLRKLVSTSNLSPDMNMANSCRMIHRSPC